MAIDRSDTGWQRAEERWQRLAWARSAAGFKSAAAFARAIGTDPHTYKAYEREPGSASKWTSLTMEKARRWAPVFGVRWEWLYDGEGLPWPDQPEPDSPAAEIGRLLEGAAPEDQQLALQMVRRLVKKAS